MAEIKIESDCGDERGKRGKRGRDGDTGPTGPTGATGPTGPSEAQGLPAYGFAVNVASTQVEADDDVPFSLGGTPFPNVGITVPVPGGSSFTVLTAGDYEYDFYVAGRNPDTPDTTALEFAIFLDGVSQGPAHEFQSGHLASATLGDDVMVCRGQGILSIGAGVVVTLRNRTGAGVQQVNLIDTPPGGEACANATLSLKKLSA